MSDAKLFWCQPALKQEEHEQLVPTIKEGAKAAKNYAKIHAKMILKCMGLKFSKDATELMMLDESNIH